MNKEIELLHNKIQAQDKIINTQALEMARLKEQNKYIEQWWKETNVIIRNDKSLAINDNAMEYILDLEEEIARLKENKNKVIDYVNGKIKKIGDDNLDELWLLDEEVGEFLYVLGDKE